MRARPEQAVALLHGRPEGNSPPLNAEFATVLRRLRPWRWRACDVVRTERALPTMPLEEAECAGEWCITLAEALLIANEEALAGRSQHPERDHTGSWVWECFENMERGSRSNGLPRGPACGVDHLVGVLSRCAFALGVRRTQASLTSSTTLHGTTRRVFQSLGVFSLLTHPSRCGRSANVEFL